MATIPSPGESCRPRFRRRALLLACLIFLPAAGAQTQQESSTPSHDPLATQGASPAVPRGKKLVLKDGSFQLVREYRIEGDRVKYYSPESSQWEEIPAALVDWAATRKVESEEERHDAAVVARAEAEERARRAEPVDVDASIEVAPRLFLPPGEGVFVFDGNSVLPLAQAEADIKLNKGHLLKQVLVPIPVIPSRRTVSLKGPQASFRIHKGDPEFYMRTADGREPEIDLIRAKVHGDSRQLENLDTLFIRQQAKRDSLPLQKWQVTRGVYRFTLGQPLAPGEYALAEIVQGEGMNLYVWDFGMDAPAPPPAPNPK